MNRFLLRKRRKSRFTDLPATIPRTLVLTPFLVCREDSRGRRQPWNQDPTLLAGATENWQAPSLPGCFLKIRICPRAGGGGPGTARLPDVSGGCKRPWLPDNERIPEMGSSDFEQHSECT